MEKEKKDTSVVDNPEPVLNQIQEVSAIQEITRAEIDTQITTAKRFPRSIKKFRDEALTLATYDEKIAGSCYYTLKRGGKQIDLHEGKSPVRVVRHTGCASSNLRGVG